MALGKVYTAQYNGTPTVTKKTIIQLTASSAIPFVLTRASLTVASTTSTFQRVQIVRFGTAAATMTSGTVVKLNGADSTAGAAVGTWASGQTDGTTLTVLLDQYTNWLSGFQSLPIPEARYEVPVSGAIALYLPDGIANLISAELEWMEYA